jgi:hypothetical protein
MDTRKSFKPAATTRPPAAMVTYSKRQPKQASSAAGTVNRINGIIDAARPGFPAIYLLPQFYDEMGTRADPRYCSLAAKPPGRSINGSLFTKPSFRDGSREVNYLQKERFSWLYRQLFSTTFIYRCRDQ